MRASGLRCLSWIGAVVLPVTALAQPAPVGDELQVQTAAGPGASFASPSVGVQPDGAFVVVWTQVYAGVASIEARRYASDGTAIGAQFQVDTGLGFGPRFHPDVAAQGDGAFVVAWQSPASAGTDTSLDSIQMRRIDGTGSLVGSALQVNSYTPGIESDPEVAAAPDASFFVVWSRPGGGTENGTPGIAGRLFTSSGEPQGSDVQVNTYTPLVQRDPDVGSFLGGGFVVAWTSQTSSQDPTSGVRARRLDASGVGLGADFAVNQHTPGPQGPPAVAVGPDDEFVVTWQSASTPLGSSDDILARRFDSQGVALGQDFVVNAYTPDVASSPDVGFRPDGQFVVGWLQLGNEEPDGIRAHLFDSDGTPVGTTDFRVQVATTSAEDLPEIGVAANGRFVIVWQRNGDGGVASIQGRRFDAEIFVDGFETHSTERWSGDGTA